MCHSLFCPIQQSSVCLGVYTATPFYIYIYVYMLTFWGNPSLSDFRGGAEIAICNPGRLIDVVKPRPKARHEDTMSRTTMENLHALRTYVHCIALCSKDERLQLAALYIHRLSLSWRLRAELQVKPNSPERRNTEAEVLDEADRMFHMGFEYQASR